MRCKIPPFAFYYFYVRTAVNHDVFHDMVVYRIRLLPQMILNRVAFSHHISSASILMNLWKSYRIAGLVVILAISVSM